MHHHPQKHYQNKSIVFLQLFAGLQNTSFLATTTDKNRNEVMGSQSPNPQPATCCGFSHFNSVLGNIDHAETQILQMIIAGNYMVFAKSQGYGPKSMSIFLLLRTRLSTKIPLVQNNALHIVCVGPQYFQEKPQSSTLSRYVSRLPLLITILLVYTLEFCLRFFLKGVLL